MSLNRPQKKPEPPNRSISYLLSFSGIRTMDGNLGNGSKPDHRFLRGPIPLPWLIRAGQCRGKALALGMYIWFLCGVKRSSEFDINLSRIATNFLTTRRSMQRALDHLEEAKLVSVTRHRGRKHLVKIVSEIL